MNRQELDSEQFAAPRPYWKLSSNERADLVAEAKRLEHSKSREAKLRRQEISSLLAMSDAAGGADCGCGGAAQNQTRDALESEQRELQRMIRAGEQHGSESISLVKAKSRLKEVQRLLRDMGPTPSAPSEQAAMQAAAQRLVVNLEREAQEAEAYAYKMRYSAAHVAGQAGATAAAAHAGDVEFLAPVPYWEK